MDKREAAGDIFPWDGTLTSSDFFLAAHMFSDNWRKFNTSVPPWLWVKCPKRYLVSSNEGEGYLSLENMCLLKSSQEKQDTVSLTWKEESNVLENEEPFDSATLGAESDYLEINHYDFHIVYSASYRVPVLYFRAYHSDGQPLLLSEIEKGLPGHSVKLLSESKWTFITQEEHPYLNRPWCKLHPCGTSEWMKLLFSSDKSLTTNGLKIEHYLVSWFSVIGQVVGLKIPLEMMDFGC
ncbi:ubiquitin-like-conjugating enzyme ATG10 isoform X1 [Prosopis cineraria]|uniref:ubiquitin-like-conjugating enzyme ATG10 isoform X1 n=1 Tax=Prosopis cineraria TaxID=364024 RepID=UPI00240F4741|nr:ubiquitin-like-conjugating enzyme ATG10 isoform X1 [Prosopis cineraria]